MSAPAPGRAPISVPSTLPRSVCRGYFFMSPHMPLKTLPIAVCAVSSGAATVIVERITSDTANMPTMMGISSAPPIRSGRPKVKRGKAAGLSRPTVDTSRPIRSEIMPLSLSPVAMNTAQDRPSSVSQKYSNELKRSANSASIGAARISTIVPNRPPMTEKTRPAPSDSSPWPLRVSA